MVVNALRRSFRSAYQLTSNPDHGRCGGEINNLPVRRRRPRDRFFEALESRTLLSSTLFVTAPGTPPDATHFLTLQAALAAANTGDTISLQSGFSPGTFISTALTQPASAGGTSIHTAAALDVGDVISLNGGSYERALVTAVSQVGSGDYLISLASPLLLAHSTSAAVHAADATIGLAQGITLTADPGITLPFALEIWNAPASASITLSSLNLGTYSLFIDGGGSTISACTLGQVVVQSGAHATSFLNNTFNVPAGDGLSLDQADHTLVSGNTFNVTSDSSVGIAVHNSANVLILNNSITTGSAGTGIYIAVDDSLSTTVDLRNNTVMTTDGIGVFLIKLSSGSSLQARLQGNVLSNNAMDVLIVGDGASAGNIDLGGGSTVFGASTGGNNFSGKSNLTVDATNFAIGLFNTSPSCVVHAANNTFSASNPFANALNLVADSLHIPDAAGTGLILASGTMLLEVLQAAPAPLTFSGFTFSGTLASFSSSAARAASDFVAVIDWGDGSSSPATIADNGAGGFLVSASHTWSDTGTFAISVVIESSAAFAFVSSSAVVSPVATRTLSLQGVAITALQYDNFAGPVATFTDSQSGTTPADYTASIHWSDGLTTNGTITANPDGSFSISTSRSFATAGALSATVDLATADNGLTASAPMTASITARALTLSGTNISLVQSATFSGILASFTDNKPGTAAADYTASIAWSDGLTTPGTIVANSNGSFSVSTSRAFPDAGSLSATVSVSALAGRVTASAPVTATIAPRAISLDAVDFTYPKNKLFTAVVATFTDNLPGTTASSYAVTVKWSDGKTTSATISKNADGSFAISTSRTFCKAGIVVASITVSTTDGLFSGSATLTATITNKNGKLPPRHCPYIFRLIKIGHPKHGCSHH